MKTLFTRVSCLVAWIAIGAATAWSQSATDFGDAPAPYPTTLKDNGARHSIFGGVFLGAIVDIEQDGQPNANALGDDLVGNTDDEDGVVFTSLVSPGKDATLRVVASKNGLLSAWLDFNGNGSWADAGDQIFVDAPLAAGTNFISFKAPTDVKLGVTFARFRFSTIKALSFTGPADNGEVEDYQVNLAAPQDFGDAPASYGTLLVDNGARHVIVAGFSLGKTIDGEVDGKPDAAAKGDDATPPNTDDEDGVVFTSSLTPGQAATVDVTVTMPATDSARLSAWLDFNGNGTWADTGEQIFSDVAVKPGVNTLTFLVPANAVGGDTFARFRLSHNGKLGFTGGSADGEVEDYMVNIPEAMDFGDAPAPYPTLLAEDGARHIYNKAFLLGAIVDVENDGQPSSDALGDDSHPAGAGDDEDGVFFNAPLNAGHVSAVTVTTPSSRGYLNAWIDFNGNGSWADAGEHIIAGVQLAPGTTNISFNVPAGSVIGATYARFRFSSVPELSFTGLAPNGEVEDYRVFIRPNRERCDLDCEGQDFWLAFPGNYAPDVDNPVKPEIYINGPAGVFGTVSIPGLGFSTNYVIPGTRSARVALPSAADLGDLNDDIVNKGVHVTASSDVSVTAFSRVHFSTDSYLALHTDVLGQEYVVMGYGNVHTGIPPLNGTQFTIIGTETNTRVKIAPVVATLGHPAGVPYEIHLQPGECYQLRNTNDAPADLTGTLIRSDKPVGVYGSHQCANIPNGNLWFCDYIVEQLLPVNTWGSEFLSAPLAGRIGGNTLRMLAGFNDTTISLNGVPVFNLDRGEFKEVTLPGSIYITSDKPIFVAQYANSSDFDGVVNSDPFMMTVQGVRHFVNRYLISTPTNGFSTNYVSIIVPTAAASTILLDGVPIAVPFTTIAGTPYSYARPLVAPGVHLVTGPVNFGLSTYGWGEYESYGHLGCFYFGDVLPPVVNSTVGSYTANLSDTSNTPGFAAVPNAAFNANSSDICDREQRPPTQTPTAGTLLGPGAYNLTVSVADSSGNIGTTDVNFTVLDPTPVEILCPKDIALDCTTTEGAVANFEVLAKSKYDPNVPVECKPASGSLFPPGTTTVICQAKSLAGQVARCSFTVNVICRGRITGFNGPTGLTLEWTGAPGVLEHAATASGPWSQIAEGVNTYKVRPGLTQEYFRVKY